MDSKNKIQEIDLALSRVSDCLSDPGLNQALIEARREADILRSGKVSNAALDNAATIIETFYPLLLDLHNQIEDLEKEITELKRKFKSE